MRKYVLAPAAEDDLLTIWHYYAEEVKDPDLADRMIGEIISGFNTVARNPGIGHQRSDLSDEPLRFWAVRKYLIIYRHEKSPIEVARVLHGARDVQSIIGGEA
jgi:plasmid stabilization system protein ParE